MVLLYFEPDRFLGPMLELVFKAVVSSMSSYWLEQRPQDLLHSLFPYIWKHLPLKTLLSETMYAPVLFKNKSTVLQCFAGAKNTNFMGYYSSNMVSTQGNWYCVDLALKQCFPRQKCPVISKSEAPLTTSDEEFDCWTSDICNPKTNSAE